MKLLIRFLFKKSNLHKTPWQESTCIVHCIVWANQVIRDGFNGFYIIVTSVGNREGWVLLMDRSTQLPVSCSELSRHALLLLCCITQHINCVSYQHNDKSHCQSPWLLFNPLSMLRVSTLVPACVQNLSCEISHADHVELLSRLRYYDKTGEWRETEENKGRQGQKESVSESTKHIDHCGFWICGLEEKFEFRWNNRVLFVPPSC